MTNSNSMLRQSPLASLGGKKSEENGWETIQAFGIPAAEKRIAAQAVGLADLSHRAKVMVEGDRAAAVVQAAFGCDPFTNGHGQSLGNGRFAAQIRFDQLHIDGPAGDEQAILEAIESARGDAFVTVTSVTDGRSMLLVVGPESRTLLSRVCALDFEDQVFPNGGAKTTSVAKTKQLIIRQDIGEMTAYRISGGRSLALYLWETLATAGRDLGVEPIGGHILG